MTEQEQQLAECLKSMVAIVKLVMAGTKKDGTPTSLICTAHQMGLMQAIKEAEEALEAVKTNE